MPASLFEARNLSVHFGAKGGEIVRAVDGVDLQIEAGETLGLVGESGCGKSTLARAVARLVAPTAGTLRYDGRDVTTARGRDLRQLRREIRIVFQDPYGSLNPRMRAGDIVAQPLRIHRSHRGADRAARVQELFARVGLDPSGISRYPHQFSGGQRQRIGIARALALEPRLVVLDEPVSALDVSIQAQIVALLRELQHDLGVAFLFISHDLAVVRHIADRVAVMYLGQIVEEGERDVIFDSPRHPYTKALLSAVPLPNPVGRESRDRIQLVGEPPDPVDPPSGCRFHPRCWRTDDECVEIAPLLGGDVSSHDRAIHRFACHHPIEDDFVHRAGER